MQITSAKYGVCDEFQICNLMAKIKGSVVLVLAMMGMIKDIFKQAL